LKGLSDNLETRQISLANIISDEDQELVIKDQYYPALINESFVTNCVDLSNNMVITGPNAAGKTTYLKTTMLNIIFTQQFGCGFYSTCSIRPYTHIHSYLNIPDTSARDSLFQAESRRCKEIIESVILSDQLDRHFCIFDELYSGTNPEEASKSAYAFLLWLSKRNNVDYILTTHYTDICSRWKKARISNWQMEALVSDDGDISYTYKIQPGISKVQGAIKVLRDMEYPKEILDTIGEYDSSKSRKKNKQSIQ
jgi:DNA mismatch repair ATPase MutS